MADHTPQSNRIKRFAKSVLSKSKELLDAIDPKILGRTYAEQEQSTTPILPEDSAIPSILGKPHTLANESRGKSKADVSEVLAKLKTNLPRTSASLGMDEVSKIKVVQRR